MHFFTAISSVNLLLYFTQMYSSVYQRTNQPSTERLYYMFYEENEPKFNFLSASIADKLFESEYFQTREVLSLMKKSPHSKF